MPTVHIDTQACMCMYSRAPLKPLVYFKLNLFLLNSSRYVVKCRRSIEPLLVAVTVSAPSGPFWFSITTGNQLGWNEIQGF